MSIKYKTMIIGILCMSLKMLYADNIHHVIWNKDIINVNIPINKEKIIEVCQGGSDPGVCNNIKFTPLFPKDLIENNTLQLINNNGVLYLNANNAFSNKLSELKLQDSNGTIILLRLSANKKANTDHIQILVNSQQSDQPTLNSNETNNPITQDQTISHMIRWVAQQLYAPQRLLTDPDWIYRVPMQTQRFIDMYRGDLVSSMPLASWQDGDNYITAILMRNTLKKPIKIDYQQVRGKWVAMAFIRPTKSDPSWLSTSHTKQDTTTLIVVSNDPFNQALNED